MGELTARPVQHGLHTRPVVNNKRDFGDRDPQISTINSAALKKLYKGNSGKLAAVWHTDISFEPAPADFTSLRLTQLPETGGDTLWASAYEMYDRISKPYRQFLETLTADHIADGFHRASEAGKFALYTEPRGSPLNVGESLSSEHPVVRTNPITGWKSIYALGGRFTLLFPSSLFIFILLIQTMRNSHLSEESQRTHRPREREHIQLLPRLDHIRT